MEAGTQRNTGFRQNPALGNTGHLRVKTGEKDTEVMAGPRIQQREGTVINGPSNSLYMDSPGTGKICETLEVEF